MKESIKSNKGFYVGDICYVLDDKIYYDVWGANGFKNGKFSDPETGYEVAVASTAYGDGCYIGSNGIAHGVDAGVIGIVPLELVPKKDSLRFGSVYLGAGIAIMEAEDGRFTFTFPNGEVIKINTAEEDCGRTKNGKSRR